MNTWFRSINPFAAELIPIGLAVSVLYVMPLLGLLVLAANGPQRLGMLLIVLPLAVFALLCLFIVRVNLAAIFVEPARRLRRRLGGER